MAARRFPSKSRRSARPTKRARRSKTPFDSQQGISTAVRFLSKLERNVFREIRRTFGTFGTLTRANSGWNSSELTYIADLAHVVAHWHADHVYVDTTGRPKLLPLDGPTVSLNALIARVFPDQPSAPIVRALLRSGIVRNRGEYFECSARQVVFPGIAAYLSGLIPIAGLAATLRRNLTSNDKRLQQTVLNSYIPTRELPTLYRSIGSRVRPFLEASDIEMLRAELRAKAGEPFTRLGLAIQMFELPGELIPLTRAQPKAIRRKDTRQRK
jgi:hypothetical protein